MGPGEAGRLAQQAAADEALLRAQEKQLEETRKRLQEKRLAAEEASKKLAEEEAREAARRHYVIHGDAEHKSFTFAPAEHRAALGATQQVIESTECTVEDIRELALRALEISRAKAPMLGGLVEQKRVELEQLVTQIAGMANSILGTGMPALYDNVHTLLYNIIYPHFGKKKADAMLEEAGLGEFVRKRRHEDAKHDAAHASTELARIDHLQKGCQCKIRCYSDCVCNEQNLPCTIRCSCRKDCPSAKKWGFPFKPTPADALSTVQSQEESFKRAKLGSLPSSSSSRHDDSE